MVSHNKLLLGTLFVFQKLFSIENIGGEGLVLSSM